MTEKAERVPGPDHPISIEPTSSHVVVTVAGRVVADSDEALTLREANYPPVQYIPRKHIDMAALQRTKTTTHCPYKGDAAYYGVAGVGDRTTDVAWSYETPHAAVCAIADHLAFYPNRVDSIELREPRT